MHTLIVILHVVVSIAMILVILLQTGKGSDIGAVFGGGSSQTLFGSTGPTSFLGKLTAGAAILFMITSLFLAYFSGSGSSRSLMKDGTPASSAPAPPARLPGSSSGQGTHLSCLSVEAGYVPGTREKAPARVSPGLPFSGSVVPSGLPPLRPGDVGGLRALGAFSDFELDALAFLQ